MSNNQQHHHLILLHTGSVANTTPTGSDMGATPTGSGSVSTIQPPSHLSATGDVMVIGQGDVGQLGLGDEVLERNTPAKVVGMKESATQVVCGGMHTVALSKEGKVRVLCGRKGEGIIWKGQVRDCPSSPSTSLFLSCFRCTLGAVMMREHWAAKLLKEKSTYLV